MSKVRPNTTKKYLSALKQIRFRIVDMGENQINLSAMCRDLGLSKSAATEMTRGGLLKNKGKNGRSAWYEWNTILPNEKMANELIKRVNYRGNQAMQKTRSKITEDVVIIDDVKTYVANDKITLTLSEQIIAAFPDNTLSEIKAAIDKLLKNK